MCYCEVFIDHTILYVFLTEESIDYVYHIFWQSLILNAACGCDVIDLHGNSIMMYFMYCTLYIFCRVLVYRVPTGFVNRADSPNNDDKMNDTILS